MFRTTAHTIVLVSLLGMAGSALAAPVPAVSHDYRQTHLQFAGTLPPQGPSSDMTPEQSYNFRIGRLSAFARACGYFSMAQELGSYQTDSNYFAEGRSSLAGADTVTGCQYVKQAGDEWLEYLRAR
jgi:hypothetical protein